MSSKSLLAVSRYEEKDLRWIDDLQLGPTWEVVIVQKTDPDVVPPEFLPPERTPYRIDNVLNSGREASTIPYIFFKYVNQASAPPPRIAFLQGSPKEHWESVEATRALLHDPEYVGALMRHYARDDVPPDDLLGTDGEKYCPFTLLPKAYKDLGAENVARGLRRYLGDVQGGADLVMALRERLGLPSGRRKVGGSLSIAYGASFVVGNEAFARFTPVQWASIQEFSMEDIEHEYFTPWILERCWADFLLH